MSYIKLRGSQIFTGSKLLSGGEVLVLGKNGRIEAIVEAEAAGTDDILFVEGIIAPGLVNCHCHLELSAMKGIIPEGTGMVDFLLGVMGKRQLPEEVIEAAMVAADEEMFDNGIVAIGDIANTASSIPAKRASRIYYHSFIELMGLSPGVAVPQLERGLALVQAFETNGLRANIVPHAPYSVSGALLEGINAATELGIISMHNQESFEENKLFLNKKGDFLRLLAALKLEMLFAPTGKNSLPSWLPYFNRMQSMLLVHNVATEESDLAFINTRRSREPGSLKDISICLCPLANAYIQRVYPNPHLFMNANCRIVVGTDSLASNHGLSVWNELLAIKNRHPDIRLETLLTWGTINGATALGLEDRLGSFEKGKLPGVIVLEGEKVRRLF